MFDLRLIRAEVLKLRRRRGMLAIALLLTLGLMAVAIGVAAEISAREKRVVEMTELGF